jgi:putative peptidoglycan lipid II flippase
MAQTSLKAQAGLKNMQTKRIGKHAAVEADGIGTSVIKSTAAMTVATLASRLTGLIRTWAMAFALGNTLITSAYQVANNLPNVVYELVAGGLLSAAFLPVLLLQREKYGQKGVNRYGSNILNMCLIGLGALSILATVFAEPMIYTQTFTIEQDAAVSVYATEFFRIFAIQIVFYGLGGVITGILNSQRSYFLTSIAPAINNLFVIVSFFAYIPWSQADPQGALIMLAIGTSLGVAAQFVIQLPALHKTGFKWKPIIDFKDPALKETVKIAVPTLIFIVGNLVAYSCRNAFSLMGGDDGPSTLNYAWIWFQLPYGVVAVSLSRAMFTEMSTAVAKNDWESLRSYVNKGLRGTLFLIIPLAGMVFALAVSLIQIFKAGAFSQDDVFTVSNILEIWVLSLPLYSMVMYLYNTFASIRRFMVFALMNCCLVVMQIGLYAWLCNPWMLGLAGVPVADLAYYAVGAIASFLLLRHYIGSFNARSIVKMAAKVLLATIAGILVVKALLAVFPLPSSIGAALFEVIVGGILGLAVSFGLCHIFKIEEMQILNGILARIRFRRH